MGYKAILARSSKDTMKSKMLSTEVSELVFDVYLTPAQFAEIIEKYNEREFELEIK